jgi:hypothetical protein
MKIARHSDQPCCVTPVHDLARAADERRRDDYNRAYGNVAPPSALGGGDDHRGGGKKEDELIRDAEVRTPSHYGGGPPVYTRAREL